jgi:thiamine pyrophosphokinase
VHAVIVANAPWTWRPEHVSLARDADLLLAADGGANHLAAVGLRPAAVVGDLDSIRPGVRAWLGEQAMVPRPDQDHTDLEKTLAFAIDEHAATRVTVLAATGGRPDHAFENLALAARWGRNVAVELRGEDGRFVPVLARAELSTTTGQLISLLPLGRCERVTTRGLQWELAGDVLDPTSRISVSNRASGRQVTVQVEGGALLVFLADPGRGW